MKILHVEAGRNLYGGALQVLYLIRGLQARGVESLLAVPEASALALEAKGAGGKVFPMPMGGDLDLGMIPRLIRVIRRERPDIVHLHSRRGADLMGGIAARWCGVPAVLSRRVDNPENGLLVRLKYPLFRKVITISDGIRRVLLSEGLPPEQVVCVRSAVDTRTYGQGCDRAWFQREFGLPEGAHTIGVVAQLIPRKGHRFLIEALTGLIGDFPGLHLLVLGQGPEEAAIRAQGKAAGLAGRVIFAGFRGDLARLLPCLDLVALPSLKEGLGVALLQASSAGVPVVASDAGGMPEAVHDGETGLLVPPGDSTALAVAIGRVLGDPSLSRRLGEGGRQLMSRAFSIDSMVGGNISVYQEVIGKR